MLNKLTKVRYLLKIMIQNKLVSHISIDLYVHQTFIEVYSVPGRTFLFEDFLESQVKLLK